MAVRELDPTILASNDGYLDTTSSRDNLDFTPRELALFKDRLSTTSEGMYEFEYDSNIVEARLLDQQSILETLEQRSKRRLNLNRKLGIELLNLGVKFRWALENRNNLYPNMSRAFFWLENIDLYRNQPSENLLKAFGRMIRPFELSDYQFSLLVAHLSFIELIEARARELPSVDQPPTIEFPASPTLSIPGPKELIDLIDRFEEEYENPTPQQQRDAGLSSSYLYSKDIGRQEVLTREEEFSLYETYREGLAAETLLIEQANLSNEEIQILAEQARRGREAWDKLVKRNLRLVMSVARRYLRRGLPYEDLIQEGNIGLFTALKKFDHTRGNKISTYATWWIRQAIKLAIYNQVNLIRIPVHVREEISHIFAFLHDLRQDLGREPTENELLEVSGYSHEQITRITNALRQQPTSLDKPLGDDEGLNLAEVVQDTNAENPETAVIKEVLSDELEEVLSSLPPRDQQVIRLRFGLNGERPHTLQEIGDKLGISRERVRQLEQQCLRALNQPGVEQKLRSYLKY